MAFTNEQLKAINECGQNIIVSAGAGSGKTRVLAQRVFDRISNEKFKWNIDEMLVLTFTNAAAANMKVRIRDRLLLNEGGLLSSEEVQKQLNKIDSSYIMTFDAYAGQLVKKYHQQLGIDADIKVIDSNIIGIKTQELLDDIMNKHYASNDARFINLINDFCVKDDTNIREEIIKINNKLNAIYDRQMYVDNYEDNYFSDEAINNLFVEYEKILLNKIKEIDSLLNELSEYVEDAKGLYIGIDNLLCASTYHEIKDSIDLDIKKLPNGSGNEASSIKKNIKVIIDELIKMTSFEEDELKKQALDTKDDVLCLLSLAQELNDGLLAYKASNNMYEFFDIFNMAISLVDKYPYIREEIKAQFKEILIDEYQDTNDLQDEFISRIADDNVYMVGDIKQSIYRFRNANPNLFIEKYESYKNNDGGLALDLTYNFRSRNEVLKAVNDVFSRLMDLRIGGADYLNGHQMLVGNKDYETEGLGKVNNQSSEMEILNYEISDGFPFEQLAQNEVEAFIIAKDIKDKIANKYQVTYIDSETDASGKQVEIMKTRDAIYSDFTILCDRGTSFETFKQILTASGIPCDILAEEKMDESDLMTVIRSAFKLLCAIKNEDDGYDFKYAYASLARSFLVEMNDDELFDIATNNNYKNSDLYLKLKRITTLIDTKTISEVLDEIVHEFDLYTKIYKIGDVFENYTKLDYLYQLANSLNEAGYNYSSFNDYLVDIFDRQINNSTISFNIQKGNKNAVKITNIHKSKGLEYSICYYPLLYVRFNRQDINSSFVFSKDRGLAIPTMIAGKGLKQTLAKEVLKHDYDLNDIGERIRLFYVALTRAKEKMILVAPLTDETVQGKIIDDNRRLAVRSYVDLLNLVYEDLSEYIKNVNFDDYKDFINYNYKINDKDIFKAIPETKEKIEIEEAEIIEPIELESGSYSKKAGLIDIKTINKMELGSKIHYILQVLDFNNPDYEYIDDEYKTLIKAFLSSDIMDNVKDGKVYKEYEFIYKEENTLKHGFIDLLVEYDDHFDIIDYKTKNIDDDKYDEQLNGYRKYIESISDKKVNCYLYSIMDSNYREVK